MNSLKYLLILATYCSFAQSTNTIKGNFANVINTEIAIRKYNLNQLETISYSKTNDKGDFIFEYPSNYSGAATIEIKNGKSVIVLLNKEDFEMQWQNSDDFKTLYFSNSYENNTFNEGIELYQTANAKELGLNYLIPLYANEKEPKEFLTKEAKIQNQAMASFINEIPEKKYVNYYLKIRKLIADIVNTKNQSIENLNQQFKSLELTDQRLINSGLYFELLDAYFVLLENREDDQYLNLIECVDNVVARLDVNPSLKQNVAEHLFNLLEKRSLTKVSEHLALSMLSNSDCKIEGKLEALFEQYRKMAIGNSAPIIQLSNSNKPTIKFENIKNKYKLIVFGASWCQKCTEEIPRLKTFYDNWKKKNNLEIIFISLDNDLSKFKEFSKNDTWISSCDLQGWESKTAREYYVFATPTMFLLDANNKILLKPISPEQITSWLETQI
jgi:peroxiredoxin